jgi:phage baseplate assembly protein W
MADLSIKARSKPYSDIDFAFRPVQMQGDKPGDVALKKDVEAVKQSVLNILKTNRGERPFLPSFGANIRSYLFENVDPVTKELIKEEIVFALRNFEPRVNILSIDVSDLPDKNSVIIRLDLEIITPVQTTTSLEFTVERLR